jgi:glutaredoxin
MKLQVFLGVLACVAAMGAQAQYKYIGPDGKVTYSDQPPPAAAKVLEKKPLAGSSAGGSDMPFALAQAVKSAPATLYTAPSCGEPCSDARSYLNKRGIPYTEKTVTTADDGAKFKKDLGTDQLPVLTVGSSKQVQWQQDSWATALNVAGYPADNQLPAGYKNPAPVPVAPPAAASTAVGQAAPGTTPANAPANRPAAAPAGSQPSWFKGF